MTTNPLKNIRRTAVPLALSTGLAGAAAAPAMANSLSIGGDAAPRYGQIDFDLHNEGPLRDGGRSTGPRFDTRLPWNFPPVAAPCPL